MGYSNDLRVRVIQVVAGGAAARAAARQFVIGDRQRSGGRSNGGRPGVSRPDPTGGRADRRSNSMKEWLLDSVRREPDLTLEEIQGRLLDERQRTAGIGSVWRFFDRHGISFKKKRARG